MENNLKIIINNNNTKKEGEEKNFSAKTSRRGEALLSETFSPITERVC
jgi:hypothetical protein